MVYNWCQIGKCTWAHSFTFLRQPRKHAAMVGFSVTKNGRFFIREKSMDDNLYSYHVALTTKAKDRQLRRSTKEKLSYTAWWNVCAFATWPKTFRVLANSNCFLRLRKSLTTCFSSQSLTLLSHPMRSKTKTGYNLYTRNFLCFASATWNNFKFWSTVLSVSFVKSCMC